jgi:hypothetical protein
VYGSVPVRQPLRNASRLSRCDDEFHLFTFDPNTNRPQTISVGTRVRVASNEGDQTGARHATDVTVVEPAQGAGTANSSAREAAPIPPSMQNVEKQIQDDARRWRLGARAGMGIDPELILFGIHSQMGPIFSRNVFPSQCRFRVG